MPQWTVVSKRDDLLSKAAMNLASLGAYGLLGQKSYVYEVEHELTGERKTVRASESNELGDMISEADFTEE